MAKGDVNQGDKSFMGMPVSIPRLSHRLAGGCAVVVEEFSRFIQDAIDFTQCIDPSENAMT